MLTRRVVLFFLSLRNALPARFFFPPDIYVHVKRNEKLLGEVRWRQRRDYLAAPAPCAASAAPSPSTGSSSGIPKALLYACTALKRLL